MYRKQKRLKRESNGNLQQLFENEREVSESPPQSEAESDEPCTTFIQTFRHRNRRDVDALDCEQPSVKFSTNGAAGALPSVIDDLAEWMLKYSISHECGNELLAILGRKFDGLPKDILSLAIRSTINDACKKAVAKSKERENNTLTRRLLEEIKSIRKEITELRQGVSPPDHPSIIPKVPFDNMEDFLRLEDELEEDPEKVRVMKMDLRKLPHGPTKKFVSNAWRKLLTDELAQKLCWRGTNEKLAARSLTVGSAIRDTFVHDIGGREEDFNSGSISFFQFAKSRSDRRETK